MQNSFAAGILARKAALRYLMLWCKCCGLQPREACAILRLLAEGTCQTGK